MMKVPGNMETETLLPSRASAADQVYSCLQNKTGTSAKTDAIDFNASRSYITVHTACIRMRTGSVEQPARAISGRAQI